LQSASKRGPVNRHHHGLAAVLNAKQQRKQASARSPRGHLAEFLDVSAGDKSAAAADYDRCLNGSVSVHLINRRQNSLRHARTESVDRWVVDGNDRDIIV